MAPLALVACLACGAPAFAPRRYCSLACYGAAKRRGPVPRRCLTCGQTRTRRHRCPQPVPPRVVGFPGADVRTLAEALDAWPVCDRCRGPWRVVDEGLACRVCPRRVRIVEALAAMLARGLRLGRARS